MQVLDRLKIIREDLLSTDASKKSDIQNVHPQLMVDIDLMKS